MICRSFQKRPAEQAPEARLRRGHALPEGSDGGVGKDAEHAGKVQNQVRHGENARGCWAR